MEPTTPAASSTDEETSQGDFPAVSVDRAAALLGVSVPMIIGWVADGLLPSTRIDGEERLMLADLSRVQELRTAAGREAARLVNQEGTSARVRAARARAIKRMGKR